MGGKHGYACSSVVTGKASLSRVAFTKEPDNLSCILGFTSMTCLVTPITDPDLCFQTLNRCRQVTFYKVMVVIELYDSEAWVVKNKMKVVFKHSVK